MRNFKSFKSMGEYLLRQNLCPVCETNPKAEGKELCDTCKVREEETCVTPQP